VERAWRGPHDGAYCCMAPEVWLPVVTDDMIECWLVERPERVCTHARTHAHTAHAHTAHARRERERGDGTSEDHEHTGSGIEGAHDEELHADWRVSVVPRARERQDVGAGGGRAVPSREGTSASRG
jgi:hypothetical protein